VSVPSIPVSEVRLAAIVESSDDAIITKDREGIITSWNPAAERMYGYSTEEAIGRPISILIPDHRAGEERMILDRVLAGDRVDHYESERVHRTGRLLRVSLSVAPLVDESGEFVGASIIARDITDQDRTREFAARLHELTRVLSTEITREGAVKRLLEQAVGGLGADAGAVGMVDSTGREIELVGSVGYTEAGIGGWQRFPVDADVPMSIAVRTGEAVWTESAAELSRRYKELADANIPFASLAVIPLAVDERPFGAMALSFSAQHLFGDQERTFLVTAAQQAAQTLDRARLYENERLAGQRLSFLADAGELLGGSLDPDTTLQNLADLAIRGLADWCAIDLVDEAGGLRNVATAHIDPAKVRLANDLRSRYPVDPESPTGVPNVIRTARSELYPEIPDELLVEAAQDEEHLRLMRELGLESGMVVPLEARGRVLGAMTLVASVSGRRFDQGDLQLSEDLARRAALAIDNSMLFRREHEAAVTLQRSLLPESLPELAGVEFAADYEPAAPGLEVGGDWYDVVALDDDRAALTIGDIAGRGIQAATVMGRVSAALRAYVLDRQPPDEALRRVNRVMREWGGPQMATVLHLHLDLASGTAEYVRAGHPPGLIRLPTGEVERLGGEGTPPLGAFDELEYPVHRVDVRPGSLLLLYTDGLIERSDRDFDVELGRLCDALAEAPGGAADCLAWLADRFRAGSVPDDVAMLAMSRS
jgi:PAS domain S-box-containing protein